MVDKSQNLLFYWLFRLFYCWQIDLLLLISQLSLFNLLAKTGRYRKITTQTIKKLQKNILARYFCFLVLQLILAIVIYFFECGNP